MSNNKLNDDIFPFHRDSIVLHCSFHCAYMVNSFFHVSVQSILCISVQSLLSSFDIKPSLYFIVGYVTGWNWRNENNCLLLVSKTMFNKAINPDAFEIPIKVFSLTFNFVVIRWKIVIIALVSICSKIRIINKPIFTSNYFNVHLCTQLVFALQQRKNVFADDLCTYCVNLAWFLYRVEKQKSISSFRFGNRNEWVEE